jgi:uncharacterized membrane protein YdjX (TVP38/TMEM64 family)
MKRKYWLVLTFWLILIIGFYFYAYSSNSSINQIISSWLQSLASHPYSGLLLLTIYLIRPLLLLPISILTVFTGFLYGPILGGLYAVLATLISSSLAYGIGRFFNKDIPDSQSSWATALRKRSFETVLTSRLIFLPGDLVNYTCGFLHISYIAFILATALGGFPGLLVGILAGASIQGQFNFQGINIEPWYLLSSIGLLLMSLGLSHYIRSRKPLEDLP